MQGREQLRLVQRVVEAVNAAESALGKLEQEWAFVPQVWSDMELQKGLERLGQLSSEFSKHARCAIGSVYLRCAVVKGRAQ